MDILALLFAFGTIIYVGGKMGRLENRVSQLEKERQGVAQTQVPFTPVSINTPQAQGAMPTPPVAGGTAQTTVNQAYYQQPVSEHTENPFVAWLKEDFLVKLGALLLLLALGWFVSYAFANNWIGPVGRITLGLLVGIAFLGAGVWRIQKYLHQGGIFTVIGATTILLTMFAARELYNFFTPASALTLMFFTVVFVAFVSVRYNSQALAHGGLILGSIAPLFTNTPTPDVSGLFLYLLIVTLGTLWVVWRTGWCTLTFVSMIMAFLYSLPFLLGGVSSAEQDIALLYSFVFVGVFFIANLVSLIFRKDASYAQAHILTAVGTGVYLLSWVAVAADEQWQSLLFVAWALVFMFGSYIVYTLTANRVAFYIYGSTSMVLIGAATAVELSGAALAIAYTLEVAILLAMAVTLRAPSKLLSHLSLVFFVPVLFSVESFASRAWRDSAFQSDSFVLLLLAVALLAVGLFINSKRQSSDDHSILTIVQVLLIGSAVYWVSLVWLVTHALFIMDSSAVTVSLVIYTISGITMFISGKMRDITALRIGGAVLIALVIARLMFIEIWDMSIGGRIIAFFVIGLLLVSTAFFQKGSKKKKEVIETNLS